MDHPDPEAGAQERSVAATPGERLVGIAQQPADVVAPVVVDDEQTTAGSGQRLGGRDLGRVAATDGGPQPKNDVGRRGNAIPAGPRAELAQLGRAQTLAAVEQAHVAVGHGAQRLEGPGDLALLVQGVGEPFREGAIEGKGKVSHQSRSIGGPAGILGPMPARRALALATSLALVVGCGAPAPSTGPSPSAATSSQSPSAALASPSAVPRSCAEVPAPSPAAAGPWWSDAIVYEVFVRSFADADGDGIGDLRGLTGRLDALNDGDPATTTDLGVTALWLMPVAASPSYHGYDVTDYRTVEPDYGTNEDFRALVAAAHERGIRIVIDLVINHTSIEHPWFQDARTPGSEHDAWYRWATTRPDESGPGGRPVWHPSGQRWYYGYFWDGMPDLDVTSADVTAELDDVARFWIEDMGVDGFRIDAARHLIEDGPTQQNTPATFDWLRGYRERVHAVDPEALVLGEVWDSTSIVSDYVEGGSLDLAFEFDLAAQLLLAVKGGDAGSLAVTRAAIDEAYPPGRYATFLTNHDQDRTFDVLGRDMAKAKQAATLLLTGPGVPFVYYGEEVGLRGRKPDERIRTPLPWDGQAPGYGFTTGTPWEAMAEGVETANVASQTDDPASLLSHYRSLIRLRGALPALAASVPVITLETSDPAVHAILRHDPETGSAVVVVGNLGGAPLADVKLTLADGPLCGSPATTIAFSTAGSAEPAVAPIPVTASGGIGDWSIGALAAHQDVVIALD
jgi:alpha-amylase